MTGKMSREDIIKRKVSLAQELDSRVVRTRTGDSITAVSIVRQADRAFSMIRGNLGMKYDAQQSLALIAKYRSALEELNRVAIEACAFVDTKYKVPESLQEKKESDKK